MTDPRPPSSPRGQAEAFDDAEVARITGGRLERSSTRPIHGAAVDSRRVEPGNLFVALPGERTDGHEHLAAAVEAGAAALLVSRPGSLDSVPGDVAVIRVAQPLAALHALAGAWRRRFDPLTVGITGSIAKTSTKEAVAAVLSSRFQTLKNEGNENNEIGLPLTVLRLRGTDQALVLEMGMYVEGEIADLVRIGQPRIGVVTAVQPVHLARIGSLEAIDLEKGRLVEGLPPGGTAILNADDERVLAMADRTAARVLTYGFSDEADVRAEAVVSSGPAGMGFTLRTPSGSQPVAISQLGRHAVHNALAAAAVGLAAGLDPATIATALGSASGAAHRGELIRLGDVTVIDDSYNAAPASMLAALDVLAGLRGRRVAVLGEMLELGEEGIPGHLEVGRAAGRVADLLIVVGDDPGDDPGGNADALAYGAAEAGLEPERILRAADAEAAHDELRPRLIPGDVVLVKGSRGIALDGLVEALRRELEP